MTKFCASRNLHMLQHITRLTSYRFTLHFRIDYEIRNRKFHPLCKRWFWSRTVGVNLDAHSKHQNMQCNIVQDPSNKMVTLYDEMVNRGEIIADTEQRMLLSILGNLHIILENRRSTLLDVNSRILPRALYKASESITPANASARCC